MRNAMRTVALALFLVLAGNADVCAQTQGWWWGFTYQTSLTTGEMKDFVDDFSWRNMGVEGRSKVGSNATLGVFLGWNVFSDEVDGTISFDGLDVSGYQSRWVNAFPMLVTGHYYLGQRGGPRTYVGLGAGSYWIRNRLALGQTSVTIDKWHFGLAPEVGVVVPTQGYSDTYLSVKYNYAVKSGEMKRSYWTFGVGIATPY